MHGCCMCHTGDNVLNSFGPKVIWISVAAVLQDAQLPVGILPTAVVKMVDKKPHQ